MNNKDCRWCWYDRTDIGSLHFHWDIVGGFVGLVAVIAGLSMDRMDIGFLGVCFFVFGILMQTYGITYFEKLRKKIKRGGK